MRRMILLLLAALEAVAEGSYWTETLQFKDSAVLENRLETLASGGASIGEFAVSPTGEWILIRGAQITRSTGFPQTALQKITEVVDAGREIDVVAFSPTGSWLVVAEQQYWLTGAVAHADELRAKLAERLNAGKRVNEVQFTSDNKGWVLLSGDYAWTKEAPDELRRAILDRHPSGRRIQGISIGQTGRWALWADQWVVSNGANERMRTQLTGWPARGKKVSMIRFGQGSDYVMYSQGPHDFDRGNRAERIEYGLQAGSSNMFKRMRETNVPGLSLAVIRNNAVEFARAYGTLEAGTPRFASASSPFDAASLSKFITALGFMRVAQEGLISLDTDARAIAAAGGAGNALGIWKHQAETKPRTYGIEPPRPLPGGLTMRRLLSHTASLDPWASVAFSSKGWPLPPTSSLLLGFTCRDACKYGDESKVVWWNLELGQPGSGYRYSGGGYLVVQAALEHATGSSFPALIHQRVFVPLEFQDSSYVLKAPDAVAEKRLACHHDENGDMLKRNIYPWAAAGGLYASARDFARAMIPLLNAGRRGDGQRFLPASAASAMLTNHVPAGSAEVYGLGVRLANCRENDSGGEFCHGGSHNGRAYAQMLGNPGRGQGVVVMVNSEGPLARTLVEEVLQAFRCAYGWDSGSGCLP